MGCDDGLARNAQEHPPVSHETARLYFGFRRITAIALCDLVLDG